MVSTTTASCPEAAATLAAMNGTIARSGSSRPWVQLNSILAISGPSSGSLPGMLTGRLRPGYGRARREHPLGHRTFASCSIPRPDEGPRTGEEPMTQAPAATMETLEVTGGVPLHGEVTVRGAKNAVPKDMVAALLTEDDCVISNVPRIQDVDIVSDMLTVMGGEVATPEPGTLRISTADVRPAGLDELKRFAGSSRIPILLCGPLLHRFGEAVV